jgi:hypothetical protein
MERFGAAVSGSRSSGLRCGWLGVSPSSDHTSPTPHRIRTGCWQADRSDDIAELDWSVDLQKSNIVVFYQLVIAGIDDHSSYCVTYGRSFWHVCIDMLTNTDGVL